MKKNQQQYSFSPSDLTRFMESAFASWMDRLSIERPEKLPDKDPEDLLMSLLQKRGFAHEDALEAEFVEQGKQVVKVTGKTLQDKYKETLHAMQSGAVVIIQARLENPPFAGFSDFLIKTSGASNLGDYHYEVWDTKLSSALKPSFVMQLCCYAEMLEAIQGRRPKCISVVLGNNERSVFKTDDFFFYYLSLKQSFLNFHNLFDSDNMPDPAESKSYGHWSKFAESLLLDRDHLINVASITRAQIKRLNDTNITSMDALAVTNIKHIQGISNVVLERLKAQAAIQKASTGKPIPNFEILSHTSNEKKGLSLLPPKSPLDVFFDIEGFPLDEGGLEYLWGNAFFNESGERVFKDYWAHDKKQEKESFNNFISWVYKRWQQDPGMHIFHYGHYEIAACRKLMGRYGVCEYEVDQLLRNEVFVDLYKVVKGGLLLGESRYSIKNVEHLYRGVRETEVGSGGDSVAVYEQWRERHAQGEEGDTWQTSKILNDIRDYNIDDCNSTQELVDWLWTQQKENGIQFLGKTEVVETEITEEISELVKLRDTLLNRSEEEHKFNKELASISENIAWMLEFHRRESKPIFWKLFDRLGREDEELLIDLDCLSLCQRTQREPYKIKRSFGYEYSFDVDQEFKAASMKYYVLGDVNDKGQNQRISIETSDSDFSNGVFVVKSRTYIPPNLMSLIPDDYIHPAPIPSAIKDVATRYAKNTLGQCAILDFLGRVKPRIRGHKTGIDIASSRNAETNLKRIITAVINLDNSYLPIQGPPGSGKTYTGKHVIAELLKLNKRIGICSNSHKAINNLLISTASYCQEHTIKGNFACTKATDPKLEELGVSIVKNNDLVSHVASPCVVGTTAWGFSRDDMVDVFDYLFIDEAGQVSVANLVAISRSTSNLVIMGDQMQLGQPIQGTHPTDSGLSVLDYLLGDESTIKNDSGIFLGTTYRMHSDVNRFISDAVYDGKLNSHPDNDNQIVVVPEAHTGLVCKQSGLIYIPVEHEGNTQASDEEIAVVVKLAKELLGRTFIDKTKNKRQLGWEDILFVSPYNFQVNKLKATLEKLLGGDLAKVGSVDKFQGQEAPVVILSMCASDASESPRGTNFLFDKNRLNVAVSRAQSLAILVANPELENTQCSQVSQLKMVNMYNALCRAGRSPVYLVGY